MYDRLLKVGMAGAIGACLMLTMLAPAASAYAKKSWFGLIAVSPNNVRLAEIDTRRDHWRSSNFTEKQDRSADGDQIRATYWMRDRQPRNGHKVHASRKFWDHRRRCTQLQTVSIGASLAGPSTESGTTYDCYDGWGANTGWGDTPKFSSRYWRKFVHRQYHTTLTVRSQAFQVKVCQEDVGPNTCSKGYRFSWISW